MEIKEGIQVEDFVRIQEAVGFGQANPEQVKKALENSVYQVSAWADGKVVGMARLIGDMARNAYIQDLFIIPEYQRQGIGSKLLNSMEDYVKTHAISGTYFTIGLMAAKGKEPFYQKYGYVTRANENHGSGMQKYMEIL